MKNVPKILVLGVGGNVSIGILKAIKNSDINAYILGACVQKYAAGFYFCDEALICPYANHESFLPWVKKVVEDNDINIVLTGVEEINNVLSNVDISSNKCLFLVPEKHYLDIFGDKLKTIDWLKNNDIDHPKTIDLYNDFSFDEIKNSLSLPFIIKPKIGKGSANIFVINNEEQFLKIDNKNIYVAQQLIGDSDSEYTCGVYKSKFGYTEIIIMRRLLRNGSTIMAEVVENKEIYDYCRKISEACDTTVPFNIQLRLCNKTKKPFCFEVNMRLSGTTAIRHGFGFKDCQVWIKESLKNTQFHSDFNIKPGIAIRYESEVFFNKNTINSLSLEKLTAMVDN
jgi:carbamoyl-phosphate synthase large subunit